MGPASEKPATDAERAAWRAVVAAAARSYRPAGRFAEHFARGKLARDPVFAAVLAHGLVPDGARLADLGCGQGLLGALLFAAEACRDRGPWPPSWPAPPRLASLWGIDVSPRLVRAARSALGARASIHEGDLGAVEVPPSDAIALLDVLQYVPPEAQRAALAKCRAALAADGVLLLRVADARAGLRFRLTTAGDRIGSIARGTFPRLHSRPLPEWMALLAGAGFARVQSVPTSAGTPFANVLLVAGPAAGTTARRP